jgi:8-oxo-dGTP pyrophosphatase MutT (NUDIX family)
MSEYLASLRKDVGSRLILTPGVLALIRDVEGRVLIQRRADNGRWVIPGGCVDPGEPPARAVVREVLEESGLLVRPVALIAVAGGRMARYPNGDELEMTAALFVCEIVTGSLLCRDGESTELQFVDEEDIEDGHLTNGLTKDLLMRPGAGAWFEWNESWLAE